MLGAYNNGCALRVIAEGNELDSQAADDLNAEFGIRLKNKKGVRYCDEKNNNHMHYLKENGYLKMTCMGQG